jgi:hypothetical protein
MNLGPQFSAAEKEVGTIRYALFEYYRAIRNLVTHRDDPVEVAEAQPGQESQPQDTDEPGESEAKRTGRRRKKLDRQLKAFLARFSTELPAFRRRLEAPNGIDELRFDDFILCTRNLKEIAREMSRLGTPSDRQILASVQDSVERFYSFEPHNPDRVRRRIATEIRSRHGVDRPDSERIASLWQPE